MCGEEKNVSSKYSFKGDLLFQLLADCFQISPVQSLPQLQKIALQKGTPSTNDQLRWIHKRLILSVEHGTSLMATYFSNMSVMLAESTLSLY